MEASGLKKVGICCAKLAGWGATRETYCSFDSWWPLIHCVANGFKPDNVVTTSGGGISIPVGLVPNSLQKMDTEEFTGEFCSPSI